MKAVLCEEFGDPQALRVGDVADPVAGEGQIRIDVHAAAVSFMDRLMVQGGYQLKPPLPFSPGTDAAGVVSGIGEGVEGFTLGERVIATGWFGAYAAKMVTGADRVTALPEAVPFDVASTIPYAYLTAWHALVDRAVVRPGETMLVTGAGGGAGLAALDVGRHLGAELIAVIGSPDKEAVVREYGAKHVININEVSLRDTVKELTAGRGVDVCYEGLGGDTFMAMGRLMAFGGRLMPIGFASGSIPALPMNLPLLKGYSVVGVFMGVWRDKHPDASKAAMGEIVGLVAEGKLMPRVHAVMPLEQAAEAMQAISDRKVIGRIVLSPQG